MNAIKVETTVQVDGELHLTQLPCRKGNRVEAIVLVLDPAGHQSASRNPGADEKRREEALRRFQALADSSRFRSEGPYPTRDELHERG